MKKFLLLIFFFVIGLQANNFSEYNIAKHLILQARANNIDEKALYTIAKIESGFKPLIISFTSAKRNFGFKGKEGVKVKIARYNSRKYIISISSKNRNDLAQIATDLIKRGYRVDVGLMQINSIHFKPEQTYEMFDLSRNINFSANVLRQCMAIFGDSPNAIECYNKGNNAKKHKDYYAKYKRSFYKDFGGIL